MRFAVAAALLAAALGGCASQSVSIRSLPPENPAAENAAAAESAAAFAAAAAGENEREAAADKTAQEEGRPALPPLTAADAPSMATYDPLERLNRFTYRFNARFDEAIYLPVANGYRRIPKPIRTGAHNFFANLTEINSAINYALQWRLKMGARSVGRFV